MGAQVEGLGEEREAHRKILLKHQRQQQLQKQQRSYHNLHFPHMLHHYKDERTECLYTERSFTSVELEEEQAHEPGSDTLLVTFDYGFSDSMDEQALQYSSEDGVFVGREVLAIGEEAEAREEVEEEYEIAADKKHNRYFDEQQFWFYTPSITKLNDFAALEGDAFQVHRMQHVAPKDRRNTSLQSTFTEYDVDEESNESIPRFEDEGEHEEEEQFYDSIECA